MYIDVEKKRRLPRRRFVAFTRALHEKIRPKEKAEKEKRVEKSC